MPGDKDHLDPMVDSTLEPEACSPKEARERWETYLSRVRRMDFRGCPDLRRYFVFDFFNDGQFKRFDYDLLRNTLVLQLESVPSLNDVYDTRVRWGLPREMPHACEDSSYTCTFQGVAFLQIQLHAMQVENALTGELRQSLATFGDDDYQHGEILDSELARQISAVTGDRYYHLCIRTGWSREINLVFRKVLVRKLNDVKPESYTGGKRVRLTRLFRS